MPHLIPVLLLNVLIAAPTAVPADPSAVALAAARVPASPPAITSEAAARVPASGYRWPLDGVPAVVRRFAPPPEPWLAGHRGVDLAADPGAVVRAAGPGVVYFAGQVAGRGVVSIEHAGGLRSTYEPVIPGVRVRAAVRAGDPIGILVSGHAGCPAAWCLHWGVRHGETYLDPLALLGLARVRLLPLAGSGTVAG